MHARKLVGPEILPGWCVVGGCIASQIAELRVFARSGLRLCLQLDRRLSELMHLQGCDQWGAVIAVLVSASTYPCHWSAEHPATFSAQSAEHMCQQCSKASWLSTVCVLRTGASSTRVSNALGGGRPRAARRTAIASGVLTLTATSVFAVLICALHGHVRVLSSRLYIVWGALKAD